MPPPPPAPGSATASPTSPGASRRGKRGREDEDASPSPRRGARSAKARREVLPVDAAALVATPKEAQLVNKVLAPLLRTGKLLSTKELAKAATLVNLQVADKLVVDPAGDVSGK